MEENMIWFEIDHLEIFVELLFKIQPEFNPALLSWIDFILSSLFLKSMLMILFHLMGKRVKIFFSITVLNSKFRTSKRIGVWHCIFIFFLEINFFHFSHILVSCLVQCRCLCLQHHWNFRKQQMLSLEWKYSLNVLRND